MHVRGYKEEGTTTTPFDMVMLNDLDRFHLVIDVIDRVPGLADRAAHVRQQMEERRAAARAYTREHGEDDPEIRDWTWPLLTRHPRRQRGLDQPQAERRRRRRAIARRRRARGSPAPSRPSRIASFTAATTSRTQRSSMIAWRRHCTRSSSSRRCTWRPPSTRSKTRVGCFRTCRTSPSSTLPFTRRCRAARRPTRYRSPSARAAFAAMASTACPSRGRPSR